MALYSSIMPQIFSCSKYNILLTGIWKSQCMLTFIENCLLHILRTNLLVCLGPYYVLFSVFKKCFRSFCHYSHGCTLGEVTRTLFYSNVILYLNLSSLHHLFDNNVIIKHIKLFPLPEFLKNDETTTWLGISVEIAFQGTDSHVCQTNGRYWTNQSPLMSLLDKTEDKTEEKSLSCFSKERSLQEVVAVDLFLLLTFHKCLIPERRYFWQKGEKNLEV